MPIIYFAIEIPYFYAHRKKKLGWIVIMFMRLFIGKDHYYRLSFYRATRLFANKGLGKTTILFTFFTTLALAMISMLQLPWGYREIF